MRSLTLRKAALGAVLPLALGSLAACGSGNDDSQTAADPGRRPRRAPTPRRPPRRRPGQATPSTPPPSSPAEDGREGDHDGALHPGDGPRRPDRRPAKGAMDMTGDKPAMQLSMDLTGMGTPTDMRIVDGVMYIQDPTSGSGKFLKMDLSDPNGPLGCLRRPWTTSTPPDDQAAGPGAFSHVTYVGTDAAGATTATVAQTPRCSSGCPPRPWRRAEDARLRRLAGQRGSLGPVPGHPAEAVDDDRDVRDYGIGLDITDPDPSEVTDMPLGGSLAWARVPLREAFHARLPRWRAGRSTPVRGRGHRRRRAGCEVS